MNLIQTIEEDVKEAWGELTQEVEADAKILWNDFRVVFTKLLPGEYTILQGFVTEAFKDLEGGDIADIETALLNKAEVQELGWVAELGSEFLQAFIAVIRTSAAKVGI